jgi:beta-lactam-binding protein with PASTA domain
MREPASSAPPAGAETPKSTASAVSPAPTSGTVVLDVEQGGIVVPSFIGKSVRSAIELAETSGIDLDVIGNGVGQDQNPPAGSHVAAGTSVTVHFGR